MRVKSNIKKRRKKGIIRCLIALSIIMGLLAWAVLSVAQPYNNPPLIGKWVSLETGKTVEFTEEGWVNVDDMKIGDYSIKEANTMIYQVDGHDFEMYYNIEERNLIWGLKGQEEYFERKGL